MDHEHSGTYWNAKEAWAMGAIGTDEIAVCGLLVQPHEHAVLVHGQPVDLTSREFEIVKRLAEHPGWVFSAEQLSSDDEDADYSPESVSVLVSRLRHKLGEAGEPEIVETVRGFGYRLHVPPCSDLASAEKDGPRETRQSSLRDSAWHLAAAVHEADHSGSPEQQEAAARVLEQARRLVYAVLSEGAD